MRQLPKIGLVLAVFACGLVAALPFRQDDASRWAIDKDSPKNLVLRRHVQLQIGPGETESPRASHPPSASSTKTTRPAVIRADSDAKPPPSDFHPPAPVLPDRFRRLDDSPSPSQRPRAPLPPQRANAGRQRHVAGKVIDSATIDQTVMVRHRIVDGDSLPVLAERYWGDGQRYRELFEFNRDVLENPDVLPIGQEIKIPFSAPQADLPGS